MTRPAAEGTAITAGISVRGEVSGNEDLYVDGEVHGAVRLGNARLTVGPQGRVSAELEAAEIFVEGRVEGTLTASQRVVLRATARVTGDVFSPRLAVEDGARFRGRVDPERAGASASRALAAGAPLGATAS